MSNDGGGMFPQESAETESAVIAGDDKYITRDEAARLLNVCPATIPLLQLQGAFRVYVINKILYRYRRSEVMEYRKRRDGNRRKDKKK